MKKLLFQFLILISVLYIPYCVHAAEFFFDVSPTGSENKAMLVTLMVDTEGEIMNALMGEIIVPPPLLIRRITDGDSTILLWVEKPTFDKETGKISFSGITPGGIMGKRKVLTFSVTSDTPGTYSLAITNVSLRKNDGEGTLLNVSASPKTIILDSMSMSTIPAQSDTIPPEPFVLSITSSPEIFDNRPFVSFLTHDKGVGIDHYEYNASFFTPSSDDLWITIESPFLLPREAYSKRVFIRAVDKEGNAILASIGGPNYYVDSLLQGIIIVLLITCTLFVIRRYFSR